ncbi:MAG: phage antirepressor [Bifidobacterium sp.]|nr:phage antirepressor [Bifidobacterium sp.]
MSATSIQPFDFKGHQVRAILDSEGNPRVCAKDAAEVLGYADSNNAIKSHCRGVAFYHPIIDSLGRTQKARFVSEGDLYRLVTSSRLPEAEEFESWIFDEVLPTIRRTGGYGKQIDVVKLLSDPQNLMTLITNYNKAEQDRQAAEAKVKELEPKAALADDLVEKGQAYTVGDAAKMLHGAGFDLGQNRLFELLREWKWVFRTANGSLKPDQSRINQGHLVTKPYASRGSHRDGSAFDFTPKILITGKGLALIHRKLSDQKFEAMANTKELAA